MRTISFGKVAVAAAGTPINFGRTTLGAALDSAAEVMTVADAAPFCTDLLPFYAVIDEGLASEEIVAVKGISGTTFTIARSYAVRPPSNHSLGGTIRAKCSVAGWTINSIIGATGKTYLGKYGFTKGGAGTLLEFAANPSASFGTERETFISNDSQGNPLDLTSFAIDAAVNGEGLYVTFWMR